MWFQSNIINYNRVIRDHVVLIQHASQCDDGYLEWYLTVCDPHIIPLVEHTNDTEYSNIGVPVDDVPSPPPTVDVDDQ